ncbi:hypothetical protein Vretimale_17615 [Volvox reticuliferus]|uniref:Uncharacterized protein n=1 Tax=Volvox reticuliferus TaxID=1737510 RepID=A0A8J4LXY3_9CHLO|nr:hypothetical protein Vretimale_17615 [Volvox reticuliferus]
MTHSCISGNDYLGEAMKKCPFLHNIAQTHGPEYASSLACKTSCTDGVRSAHRPVLADDYEDDFSSAFALFHGRGGVLPLRQLSAEEPKVLYPLEHPSAPAERERPRCPLPSGALKSGTSSFAMPLFAAAPLASMSMSWGSNWFNIHHLFQKHINQHRAQQRKPPQQPQQTNGNYPGGVAGPGLGGPGPTSAHSAGTSGGGKCPLRRALGPLAGVVFNKHGHLSCPEPIVKMRAALAATRPVQELRPQALPIKLFAVAMTTAALNVPCGMWREHTEKFSSQWFVAVHATIPFIAMLRKAVIMPKYAILFTICAAIAGQAMGAKLERRRLMSRAKSELGGLAKASVAVTTYRPSAAVTERQPAPLPVASLLMSAQPLDRPVMPAPAPKHKSHLWMATQGDNHDGIAAATGGLMFPGIADSDQSQEEQAAPQMQFRVGKMKAPGRRSVGGRRGSGPVSALSIGRESPASMLPTMTMVSEVAC